jgi:hypothetical protein
LLLPVAFVHHLFSVFTFLQVAWEEWVAWSVALALELTSHACSLQHQPSHAAWLQPLILYQGGDDEGDSDDEELPFEAAGNGGSCAARRRHLALLSSRL